MKTTLMRLTTGALIGAASLAYGASAEPVKQHNSNAVWFENWGALTNATLTVVAPNGKITSIEALTGTPVFRLEGGPVLDGVYLFELTAATDEKRPIVNPVDNGRGELASDMETVPFAMTGNFVVSRGVIIEPEEIEESSDG